jgi:hypothetical protein
MNDEGRMLKDVPAIMRESRIAGFEHLRDRLLTDWEEFISKGVNAYSALKLVIEMDRHALFAQVQADKPKAKHDKDQWQEFQDYLKGKVEVSPDAYGEMEAEPGAESEEAS